MRLRSFWVNSPCKHKAAAVTTMHPQRPVVTTVGTEGINTVAVAAKTNGRSTGTRQNHLPEGVQRSIATVARSNNYRSEHEGSEETKYDEFFEVL